METFLPQFPLCLHPGPCTLSVPPAAALVETKNAPMANRGWEGWLRAAAFRRKLTPRPVLQQQLVSLHPAPGTRPLDRHSQHPAVSFPSPQSRGVCVCLLVCLLPRFYHLYLTPPPSGAPALSNFRGPALGLAGMGQAQPQSALY